MGVAWSHRKRLFRFQWRQRFAQSLGARPRPVVSLARLGQCIYLASAGSFECPEAAATLLASHLFCAPFSCARRTCAATARAGPGQSGASALLQAPDNRAI